MSYKNSLRFKRLFDIACSFVVIFLLLPLVLFFILMYFVEMIFKKEFRGRVIYYEIRVSADKKYRHYKFRTCKMRAYNYFVFNPEELRSGSIEGDKNNFSLVGKILKLIYLDEFPQLYNVLIGDLSLVGPRPKPVIEYHECVRDGNYGKKNVKAGLTGPYQSYKGHWNGKSDKCFDNEYADFINGHDLLDIFWNDLKIILRSVKIVFEHKGI